MKYNHTSPFVYGYNPLVIASHNPELMGLNFAILKLGKKTNYCISLQKETLAVLLTGSITFTWNNHIKKVKRDNPFHDSPSLMHFDSFTECRVINDGDADCEIIIISTDNPKHFEARMYMPEDLASQGIVGETLLDGKTKRMKRVFFDRTTRPETNIFCGELVNFPGCWACFPRICIPNRKYISTGSFLRWDTDSQSRVMKYSKSNTMIWWASPMERPTHR